MQKLVISLCEHTKKNYICRKMLLKCSLHLIKLQQNFYIYNRKISLWANHCENTKTLVFLSKFAVSKQNYKPKKLFLL